LVFVFNSQGGVWVQLRPKTKRHYPGVWDISACGGIISGEMPTQAAAREAEEELGFAVELRRIESFMNVFPGENGEQRKRLSHLFVGVSDETPRANDDVDEFKIWQPDELRKNVMENPDLYVPSFLLELEKAISTFSFRRQSISSTSKI
jgi:isopentenyldiphosphate isomerase